MIARTWRGAVRAEDGDAYLDYLRATGLAEYGATPGHLGTLGLRRRVGAEVEYLLVTLWSSEDAVRAFAGPDPERAVFYPGDARFLVEAEPRVRHFETVFAEGPALRAPAMLPEPAASAGMRFPAARGWWWRGWIAHAASRAGRRGFGADLR